MKATLNHYLIKEHIAPLGVSLLTLSFVLVTGRMLQLTSYLFTSALTLSDIAQVMVLAMPKLLVFVFPMATLIGVLLAFMRLNSDNELIAMRAAGIGFHQFFFPLLGVLVAVTILSLYNTLFIPSANKAFEAKLKALGRATLPALLKEGTFIDSLPNLIFFFDHVNPSDLSIQGIFVQDQRKSDVRLAIVAEHAQIIYQRDMSHLTFRISNGIITRVKDDLKDAQAVSFKVYDLNLSLDEVFGTSSVDPKDRRSMTLVELIRLLRAGDPQTDVRYALELHQRFALPVGCLFLGLVGAPLGALFRQRNRLTGVTIGLGVFLLYYVLLSAGKGMGENAIIPAWLAIWLSNFFTAALAMYLWVQVYREAPFEWSVRLSEYWRNLTSRFRHREKNS